MIIDLTRTASVYTTLPKETNVVFYGLSGTEKLGCPYSYDVTLLSENANIGLSEILGQPICIVLRLTNSKYREFNGYVTRFSFVGTIGRHAAYRVQVEPWLALMRGRVRSRIFQGKTVPFVIEKLFGEHTFSYFSSEHLKAKYRTFEYLVQYRESDLQFVLRMMQQEGIYFYFKHHGGKHELILADSFSAHEATDGYKSVPYYSPQDNERRERDHLDQWLVGRGMRSGVYSARDFNFNRPGKPVVSESSRPLDHAFSDYEIYDYPAEFQEIAEVDADTRARLQKEANDQANIRLQEEQASFERVHAEGNARGLCCGALFKLTDYPRKDQNKEYLIIETAYTIQVGNYDSLDDPDVAPEVCVQLVAQDSKTIFRAPRITKVPTIAGPQTATVVGPSDQEIWTDEYGRVRLQFHWDREGKSDENSSCWVRVSQAWAGQKWGSLHTPRIGQEVVVSFLEGNPNRPLVTGRVYNADNRPPYDPSKVPTQSGIKSHSTKDGKPENFNEIRFEDKIGEEELHIQAEKDMTTLVKHDRTTTINRNDTLNITGDQFIKIHGNLSMTIEGVTEKSNPDKTKPVKSSLGVTGAHRIDASDTIDIQAPNKITLTCGDSVITMVPGKITLTTAGSTIAIDPNIFAQSSGKTEVMLDANAFMKASGGASMLLDANACTQSNGKSQMLLDGDAALTTSGTVSLHGAKITGKGDTEAGFDGGGSTIALNSASADLAGNQVNVNAKGVASIGGPLVKIG